MKGRILIAAAVLALAWPSGAAAQSVSGLSVKPGPKPEATTDPANLKELMRILEALRNVTDPGARQTLIETLKSLERLNAEAKQKEQAERDQRIHLAVPAGATAAVGDDQTASAGPVFGFQAWRVDSFFAGAFFTFSPAHRLNGGQRKFGEFVRHPPAEGTSFYASGSRIFLSVGPRGIKWADHLIARKPAQPSTQRAAAAAGTRLQSEPAVTFSEERKPALLVGTAFRLGVTNATFERTIGEEVVGKEAFIVHVTPSLQLLSRTFKEDVSSNEYQFGLELGPTWRFIGGDAAHDAEFLRQKDVLGHADTRLSGLEATIFVRLNAFQPFVRVTHFGRREGVHVPGLTGTQAFFGVNVVSAIFQSSPEKQ